MAPLKFADRHSFDAKRGAYHAIQKSIHTPDDDPELGTPGTGEDVCPECEGTGKQIDKETGKRTDKPCERCDGTGIIVQGLG